MSGGATREFLAMGSSLEEVVKRFQELEISQAQLRDQLKHLIIHGHTTNRNTRREGGKLGGVFPGHFVYGPYRSVLKHIGHALHIYRPRTGEIIFWNQSAENLYGWKDHEAVGKRVDDLLMVHGEEVNPNLAKISEQLSQGQSWSGLIAFKKKSGEMLVAMVTKSPLYEDGALIGIVTVSSDAAWLHDKSLEEPRPRRDPSMQGQLKVRKRVQWSQRAQIASSASNNISTVLVPSTLKLKNCVDVLRQNMNMQASKLVLRRRSGGGIEHGACREIASNVLKPKKEVPLSCKLTLFLLLVHSVLTGKSDQSRRASLTANKEDRQ